MRKYYYKDAAGQHGPLPLEKLKGKGITADTPVWYDPLPQWTTAGQVDELKVLITSITPIVQSEQTPVIEMKEDVKQQEPVLTETPVIEMQKVEKAAEETPVIARVVTNTTAVAGASTVAVKAIPVHNKSTAWVSWVLSLLILGGAGYYVYQDIEKNKDQTLSSTELSMTESKANSSNAQAVVSTPDATTPALTNTKPAPDTSAVIPSTDLSVNPATTTTTVATTTEDKKTQARKKAEEDKKKQLASQAALAKQKAEEEKKQQLAAQAASAKELQVRNNWSKYITTGSLNYQPKGDDGMTAFDVPVHNSTEAVLNKVTVRVDYYKKEKKDKILHSETVVLYNIPPKSGLNGKAPEHKKARKAVVTITGITSRKLHFCYPHSSGNNADPYYCN